MIENHSDTGAPVILHVFHAFGIGGQEVRTSQLMNRLGHRYRHRVVALNGRSDAAHRVHPDVDIEIIPTPDLAGSLPARLVRLGRWLKGQAPDLLATYNWGTVDLVAANAWSSRLPHLHHEDGFGADEARRQHRRRVWFRRLVLRGVDGLIVPSRTLEAVAQQLWKLPPAKVHYIPNGVDVAAFASPRPDAIPGFVQQDGQVVVGTLATLRREKNLPRLVRAFAAGLFDRPAKLVIVGTGSERAAIEAEALRQGIAGRVVLPGYLADPAQFVGLFDIFALSSDTEQFPISLIEAMAAGCAVAATDVGDVREILPAAQGRFIINPQDEEGLAQALRSLAADPELRRILGRQNRERVAQSFAMEPMVARYDALYQGTLQRRV